MAIENIAIEKINTKRIDIEKINTERIDLEELFSCFSPPEGDENTIVGGADGTRTRDPRRDRPVF